jgi:hypothetical protein
MHEEAAKRQKDAGHPDLAAAALDRAEHASQLLAEARNELNELGDKPS